MCKRARCMQESCPSLNSMRPRAFARLKFACTVLLLDDNFMPLMDLGILFFLPRIADLNALSVFPFLFCIDACLPMIYRYFPLASPDGRSWRFNRLWTMKRTNNVKRRYLKSYFHPFFYKVLFLWQTLRPFFISVFPTFFYFNFFCIFLFFFTFVLFCFAIFLHYR